MPQETQQKNGLIKIGDFFFKWRNIVFPVVLLSLFISFPPPAEYFGSAMLESGKDAAALLLVLAGLGLRAATIGWAYIKRGGLNKQVYADKLVTSGFFGLSRNPLYVGNMMIYAGIFIFHGHPAVILIGIALYYFIYESIIAAEECFLKQKFGEDYLEYCKKVPRWRLDFSNYKDSTAGMSFSFVRAVVKDYTTIFNAFLALVVIEMIENYLFYPTDVFIKTAQNGGVFMAVLLSGVIIIKLMKKNGKLKQS